MGEVSTPDSAPRWIPPPPIIGYSKGVVLKRWKPVRKPWFKHPIDIDSVLGWIAFIGAIIAILGWILYFILAYA